MMKDLLLNVFKPQRKNFHASCSEGAYTKAARNLAPAPLFSSAPAVGVEGSNLSHFCLKIFSLSDVKISVDL